MLTAYSLKKTLVLGIKYTYISEMQRVRISTNEFEQDTLSFLLQLSPPSLAVSGLSVYCVQQMLVPSAGRS